MDNFKKFDSLSDLGQLFLELLSELKMDTCDLSDGLSVGQTEGMLSYLRI